MTYDKIKHYMSPSLFGHFTNIANNRNLTIEQRNESLNNSLKALNKDIETREKLGIQITIDLLAEKNLLELLTSQTITFHK